MVDFEGNTYRFSNVPMELAPLQKPHPPIWFGVGSPDSAERAAAQRPQLRRPQYRRRDARD